MKARVISAFKHKARLIWAAALLSAAMFTFGSAAWQAQAQTPPPVMPQASSSPDAVVGPVSCSIGFVAVFSNRVVVRCVVPVEIIIFDFAVSTDPANSQQANRLLTLLNTAYALDQPIQLYYSNNTLDNPPGCFTNTCRKLEGLYIQ